MLIIIISAIQQLQPPAAETADEYQLEDTAAVEQEAQYP